VDKQKGLSVLLIFSLAFNLAFVGIWGYHLLYVRPLVAKQQQQAEEQGVLALAGLERLGLAPEQSKRIMLLRQGLRTKLAERMRNADEAREAFLTLLQDPQADPEALRAAGERLGREGETIRRMILDHLLAVRDALDRRQRGELARMLRQHRGPRRRHMGSPRPREPSRRLPPGGGDPPGLGELPDE